MMRLSGTLTLCLALIGAGCESQSQTAIEATPSPRVRQPLPGFNVVDITGPWRGHGPHCYCCQYGYRPIVIIFARELDGDVPHLVKRVDVLVGENKETRLAAFVAIITENAVVTENEDAVLTEDQEAFKPRLKALAESAGIAHTPLTIIEAASPPPEYQIADDAEVTFVLLVDKEVQIRRSFARGELDESAIDALIAETADNLK